MCVEKLNPPMIILGEENIPNDGPGVITINHYSRPGFRAWWLAIGVSAVVPVEVHWIFTAAWKYDDWLRRATITPLTRWAFRKAAEVYGFSTMPPMPPSPQEVGARASAVRRVLSYAKSARRPLVGLAPEGQDPIPDEIDHTPPGVGRFLLHLAYLGLPIIPVATYENQNRFCVSFGRSYRLDHPVDLGNQEKDRFISQLVMARISELIP